MTGHETARPGSLVGVWHQFWFQPVPPHAFALLRILFGLAGCAGLLGLSDIPMFRSLEGLVPTEWAWAPLKDWLAARGLGSLGGLFWAASLAAFVCMTVGLWSRAAVQLSFAALLFQHGWNYLPLSGTHDALRVFVFCLIWVDCGVVWSVDAWLAGRRGQAPRPGSEWLPIAPLRLVRFQLSLIYLSAGLWKLHSPLWRDGSAVHYALSSNLYQRLPGAVPPELEWFTAAATYATLFWELGFALMVLWGPTRRLALAAGVLMHVGMFLTLEVGLFHPIMLAAYVAFLDPFRIARIDRSARSG